MKVNINIIQSIQLSTSNKDFIYFDIDNSNNKLTAFKLSNDCLRYRNNFQYWKVLNIFKKEINKPLTIKLQ